jgi:competence protein ComEC
VAGLELQHAPVLVALLVGVSGTIPAAQWDVFRVTGTIHLMVISGLHIGLAAGFGYAIGRVVARAAPWLLLRVDARTIGAWSGVGCGLAYLALSGGGLPALRACLMAGPALLLAAWGRRSQAASALLVALGVVLALEPLALHQQGFWLSFGAVGLLILRYGRRYGRQPAWVSVAGVQVLLTVGMAPLLVVLTGAVPMVAIVANLVAVPLISFAVVPLTLLGGLLAMPWPAAAAASFWFADQLFGPLYRFLSWCAQIPQLHAEPQPMHALVAGVGVLAWLFGLPRRQWLFVGLAVACTLLPRELALPAGEFRVIGLDVGQGDAILIDTASHRLLFDAGPAFPGGFDAGAAAVVPSLLATGPMRLDALVLSHEDLDHVGGAVAVERALAPAVVYASFPRPGAIPCDAREWRWDGVVFRFVTVARSGVEGRASGSNDGSCILLIDNGRRRVLLAGDIGAEVEGNLLRALPGGVDLLFAPHHGSGSSSSTAFVRVLRPARVFVSAGRDNRYGHPHPRVLARYRAIGAEILLTAERGALIWESALPDRPRGWRDARGPYWRGSVPARTAR